MEPSLVLAGLVMGAASSPHCAAMCGAPCAALGAGCGRRAAAFQTGRLLSYMAGGAVAAASVAALGALSAVAPALRPAWVLLHLALLALGLWWLATGRQPAALQNRGLLPMAVVAMPGRPLRPALAGLAWVAWPCAALQAALALSALSSSAAGGALVMAGFALGSMPALWFGPWLLARWSAASGATGVLAGGSSLRLAGLGVVIGSGWALSHGLWQRVAAWCAG